MVAARKRLNGRRKANRIMNSLRQLNSISDCVEYFASLNSKKKKKKENNDVEIQYRAQKQRVQCADSTETSRTTTVKPMVCFCFESLRQ